jgi:hypothetical protein
MARHKITARAHATAPIGELSSIAIFEWDGASRIAAVGDDTTALFVADLAAGQPGPWSTIDLSHRYVSPETGSNFEGVAVDDVGTVVIVAELPATMLVVRAGRDAARADVRCIPLDVASAARFGALRRRSRMTVEGVILLDRGHIAVANEKHHVGLFEFGPKDDDPVGLSPAAWLPPGTEFNPSAAADTYSALAWWPVRSGPEDISDLATFDGTLYAVSDVGNCIVRLAGGHDDHSPLRVTDRWMFAPIRTDPPNSNPEGLSFLPDGRVLVGFDRDAGTVNLRLFAPLA